MRNRDLVRADAFVFAFTVMRHTDKLSVSRRPHLPHSRGARLETGFRVDQELSGDDDVLSGLQSFANFRLPVSVPADLDIEQREPAVALSDDNHAASAGL